MVSRVVSSIQKCRPVDPAALMEELTRRKRHITISPKPIFTVGVAGVVEEDGRKLSHRRIPSAEKTEIILDPIYETTHIL